MPIATPCPHCAASENFPDTDAGATVHCSACGGAINLPAKARPVAAAVVAQAKPVAAVPVMAKSKPVVELDEVDEEVRPRKKSKPAVDLDEEPTPSKKGSPSAFSFDDEETPKKKKPRRRDDDEEDDERPRRKPAPKKGGGGKLLLILGGIGFVLFAACGGIGAYVVIKMDKAVASFKSQLTVSTEPETSRPTKPVDGKPDVKGNAAKLTTNDSYATTVTKMGLGGDARIEDLQDILKNYKDPNGATGPDKGLLKSILDQYAPWVAKDCAKIYWDGAKSKALVVFSKPNPENDKSARVRGLLTLDESGNRSSYNERIAITRDVDGDAEAQALKLKHWTDLKEEGATPTPDPKPTPDPMPPKPDPTPNVVKLSAADFAAEVVKDRDAAKKKYAGVTLEITGEVNSKSGTGSVLTLKAGTDENRGKSMILSFTMKPEQRDAAKQCNTGDTVTVSGVLGSFGPTDYAFPLTGGVLNK